MVTSGTEREVVQAIGEALRRREEWLSVAESCTGGAIASALTGCSGASDWFGEARIAYTYDAKRSMLEIPTETLDRGLVTCETAMAMAKQVALLAGTDYALSTTGSCGPALAEGRPPLYAWVAVYDHGLIDAILLQREDQGREANIRYVTLQALRLLLSHLNK